MSIISDIPSSGPDVFYAPEFRNTLEYHIPSLKTSDQTTVLIIKPAEALQFRGDYFSLLAQYAIPPHYHWVVMRCNDYYSPMEFTESDLKIIVPDFGALDQLQQIYSTSHNLSIG